MTRLPVPGSDNGVWGDILNDFLAQAHNSDGTLKSGVVAGTNVLNGSITEVKLSSDVQTKLNSGGSSLTSTDDLPEGTTNLYYTDARASAAAPVQSVAGKTGGVTLAKSDVGLGNVDNTSDLSKPISTATQTALDLKADTSSLATVATTGAYSDLSSKPSLATVATSGDYNDLINQPTIPTVADASTTTKGIVKLAGDLGGTADLPTVPGLSSKESAIAAGTTSQYWRGDKSWQTLDKSAVGLANVDNTSDLSKPISTATQTALDLKADSSSLATVATTGSYTDLTNQPTIPTVVDANATTKGILQLTGDLGGTAASPTVPGLANKIDSSQKGAASGVATLDSGSKVPLAQLPTDNITKILPCSYTSNLFVGAGDFRLYNDTGSAWTIQAVRASVGTAPVGASIIIDVDINGTTIFTTQANRPTIPDGGNTSGKVTNMDVTSVPVGAYLTVDIDQIGSSVGGADLTVQVEVI